MKQIVDSAGNPIKGLFKKDDGSIVVSNKQEYEKRVMDLQKTKTIIDLNERVVKLEELLAKLLTQHPVDN